MVRAATERFEVIRPGALNETRPTGPLPAVVPLRILRPILLACQAATILVTWRLWQTRAAPPMLPVARPTGFSVGVLLLGSLVLVAARPREGAIVHFALIALAVVFDQTRLQPAPVSLALLILLTSSEGLYPLARGYLASLWFWSGLNKALAPGFFAGTGRWLFDALPLHGHALWLRPYFGAVVVLLETGAGALVCFRRTRRLGAVFAITVHVGILLALGPLGANWNSSVWPWSVALIACAAVLFSTNPAFPHRVKKWKLAAIALLAIYPAGWYVGAADAYLAAHLYTSDGPTVSVCRGAICDAQPIRTDGLNVAVPPEHRLYRAYFAATCRPGDVLWIVDGRWRYRGGVASSSCSRSS